MKLGEARVGKLIDMKEIQIHPTVAAGQPHPHHRSGSRKCAILINKEGKRFVTS